MSGVGFGVEMRNQMDWWGVGRVSDIKTLIFVIRDTFAIVALLPLTQNTLPSKDVREYVFSCFLMPGTSQKHLGMILNEFRRDSKIIIFIKILTLLRGAVNVHSWLGLSWSVAGLSWSVSLLIV